MDGTPPYEWLLILAALDLTASNFWESFSLDTPINGGNREALHVLLNLKGEKLALLQQSYSTIEASITAIVQKCRSIEIHSHKARPALVQFRAHKLPTILNDLKGHVLCGANPFIWQLIIVKLYLKLLLNIHKSHKEYSSPEPRHLQGIELNGIRYASGFVANKKYKKLKGHDDFVDCLKRMTTDESDTMADYGGTTSSLQGYIKTWLSITDRSGLSHVSDVTFWLFCEIESLVYDGVMLEIKGLFQQSLHWQLQMKIFSTFGP